MAVVKGRVSFEAVSAVLPAARFAERVGVQPTQIFEVGDLVGNGRSGRRHDTAVWSLDRDFDGGGDGDRLNEALLSLLLAFDGREAAVAELAGSFDLRVRCYGSSDSTQGGFWLSADVVRRLAAMGVEFYCTVYLDEAVDTAQSQNQYPEAEVARCESVTRAGSEFAPRVTSPCED